MPKAAGLPLFGKTPMNCPFCQTLHNVVYEFEASTLVVGAHQLFRGYCVLVSKIHAREPFELEPHIQTKMFAELMRSAKAIQRAYQPWKMNYSCYGNQVPHVHWHLFPRHESDAMHKLPPWAQSSEFEHHSTTQTQADEVISRIRAALNETTAP